MNLLLKTGILLFTLVTGSVIIDNYTGKTREDILSNKKVVFSAEFDSNRFVASANGDRFEPLILWKTPRNIRRINGEWEVTYYEITSEGEIEIPRSERRVRLEMISTSTVKLIHGNSEEAYTINNLGPNTINLFIENEQDFDYVELSLISLDSSSNKDAYTEKTKKVSNTKKREIKKSSNKRDEKIYNLLLKEAFDPSEGIKKIVKENLEGEVELSSGEVLSLFAHVNGKDIEVETIVKEGEGDFTYTAFGETGKAQGTFISEHEYNLYFLSGPHKGYTLIFAERLSDEERYEKEELERQRLQSELDNPIVYEGEQDLEVAQEDAVKQRESIVELKEYDQIQDEEQVAQKQEIAAFLNETKVAAEKALRGEELSEDELVQLEERELIIEEMGGVQF